MKTNRRTFNTGLAAGLATLAAPGLARAAGQPLAIGNVPANSIYWDIDVAADKGFFLEEGFEPAFNIMQSSPQGVQLVVSGDLNMATVQPEPMVAAVERGADNIGGIFAPMNFADWTLNVQPEIKTLEDLRGKTIGVSALRNSECWQTEQVLAKAGIGKGDFNFLVVGTSPNKIIALEQGSIAATVLFQPSGELAVDKGYPALVRYATLRNYPSIIYTVNRNWAAKDEAGIRLTRALTKAHEWLWNMDNHAEAVAILAKYSKRDPALLERIHDAYFGDKGIYSKTGEVIVADFDLALADMAADGQVLKAPAPPASKYLVPHEAGGKSK